MAADRLMAPRRPCEPCAADTLMAPCRANDPTAIGVFGGFVCLTKINWGIGMMAMPYYMYLTGPALGTAFFAVSMVLAADGAMCLARLRDRIPRCAEVGTYPRLVKAQLGRCGEHGAMFSILVANWGSSIAWIKYVGDNLHRFIPEVAVPSSAWALAVTALLLLCVFPESVASIERFSGVGLLAGQSFAALVVGKAACHWSSFGSYLLAGPRGGLSGLPVAMGLAVFCNEGMVILTPSVHASMREPRKYPRALLSMTTYFAINYILVALAGDFLFSYLPGGEVADEVSLSFDTSPLYRAAACAYLFQLSFTFPVLFFTIFTAMEGSYVGRPGMRLGVRRLMRAAVVLSAGLFAICVPDFGDFIALAGAVGNSLGIYILPQLSLLKAARDGEIAISRVRGAMSVTIILLFGVVCGVLATVDSVGKLASKY